MSAPRQHQAHWRHLNKTKEAAKEPIKKLNSWKEKNGSPLGSSVSISAMFYHVLSKINGESGTLTNGRQVQTLPKT